MPSPQLENGYTRIANELYDAIIAFDFTKRQAKLVHAIIRYTYGFHRKEWATTFVEIARITRMDRHNTMKAAQELEAMQVLGVESTPRKGVNVCLQKDYGRWALGSKQPPQINPTAWGQNNFPLGSKQPHLKKERTTKKLTTKETPLTPQGAEWFETFLKRYREHDHNRRTKRADALKRWVSLEVDDEKFTEIMAGLDRWIVSHEWVKEGGKFVPGAQVWLSPESEKWKAHPPAPQGLHQLSPELQAAANTHEDWRKDPLDTGGVFDHDDVPF